MAEPAATKLPFGLREGRRDQSAADAEAEDAQFQALLQQTRKISVRSSQLPLAAALHVNCGPI